MGFFDIKNLTWKILFKNLVTLKKWDGVKDEKFYYYEGSLKNLIFSGWGFTKKLIYRRDCLKWFKRGLG